MLYDIQTRRWDRISCRSLEPTQRVGYPVTAWHDDISSLCLKQHDTYPFAYSEIRIARFERERRPAIIYHYPLIDRRWLRVRSKILKVH